MNKAPEESFRSFNINTLKANRIPPLDLYIKRKIDTTPILYRSRSLPLTDNEIKELMNNDYGSLFVKQKDYGPFSDLMGKDIAQMIQDETISTEAKCEVVYNYSTNLMKQVYESPEPSEVIKASDEVIPNVTEVIFGNKKAAHEFITRASIDYEIYSHSINVCLFGVALARHALGITKADALSRFGPGLLLHDIGKLNIPKEILEKETSLTDEEWEIIKKHPIEGLEMVQEFMEVTPECEAIILHHHERLDGSGYPYGLEGDQISIGARICAITDIFDAISTHRPFRERKTSFESFMTMKRELYQGLDKDLFEKFLYIFIPPKD